MATPDGIRFHLIKLQADELTRIIAVLKSTRPSNMVELVETVRVLRAELAAAVAALQGDRAAVARAQASTG